MEKIQAITGTILLTHGRDVQHLQHVCTRKQLLMRSALSLLPRTSTVVQHLRFNSTRTFFIWMIHSLNLGHCFPFLFPEYQNPPPCFWSCLQNLVQDKSSFIDFSVREKKKKKKQKRRHPEIKKQPLIYNPISHSIPELHSLTKTPLSQRGQNTE